MIYQEPRRPWIGSGIIPPLSLAPLPLVAALIFAPALLGVGECETEPTPTPPPQSDPVDGDVHGRAMLAVEEGGETQFLPGLTVSLVNIDTFEVMQTTTDVHGRYRFSDLALGVYQLCWEGDGFKDECQAELLALEGGTVYPDFIEAVARGTIEEDKLLDAIALVGQVTLAGGTSCYVEEPFFSTYQNAEVSLLDALSGLPLIPSVQTNSEGRYVIPEVPILGELLVRVQATCGGGTISSVLDLGGILTRDESTPGKSLLPQILDLTLDNSAPLIGAFVAFDGGLALRTASPGQVVDLDATVIDPDGDSLAFSWRAEAGALSPGAGGQASWTLPTTEGRYTVNLLVDDGQGGMARGQLSLRVAASPEVVISGAVSSSGGDALGDARVRLNGLPVDVDLNGTFVAQGLPGGRNVLEVQAEGHLPSVQIFDDRAVDLAINLREGLVATVDPSADINLSASASGAKSSGVSLMIPGGALVDSSGAPPAGDVSVTLAALDPTAEAFPTDGDYKAASGDYVRVSPMGGAFVHITSPDGETDYNLASGQEAEVRVALPDAYLEGGAQQPQTLPVWLMDEESGIWNEEGSATLDGDAYVFSAPHFSLRSVGMAESQASCLRVRVDDSLRLPLKVAVEIPITSTEVERHQFTLTDGMNAIHHLPRNRVINIVPLDRQGKPREALRQNIDTGNPIQGQEGARSAYPYAACNSEMLLKDFPEPHGFHSYYLFLTAEGRPDEGQEDAQAQAYYDVIDPTGARDTLGGWWRENGFDEDTGAGGTRGVFYNANELAYWRDMNCTQSASGEVACWVAKHWDGAAAVAGDGTRTDEVVAMEWRSLSPGSAETVTFAAYGGQAPNAPRATYADFDGLGNRQVPWVCMNCHGGTYEPKDKSAPTQRDAEMAANFLMFDLDLFEFSDRLDQESQEEAFYELNQIIKATNPPRPVTQLIDGWYEDGTHTFQGDYLPPTWESAPQDGLYRNLVAPACRSCHVSQEGLEWDIYKDGDDNTQTDVALPKVRNFIRLLVCGTNHMPHARPTYTRFWTSEGPHQPTFLAEYQDLSVGWSRFEDCE